jgi:saccharopine dehydrogenase-like NADP-dependent oxidoreductase
MKKILLFGAGKSATCLIDYLISEIELNGYSLTVADSNLRLAQSKIGNNPYAKAVLSDVQNDMARSALIQDADIVISMLPPSLHFLVAKDCIEFGKNLLTASYVDEKIKQLEKQVNEKKLLFLCELGLDPGIDHMSAMELITRIKKEGGKITSFKSHTGGLVAPESDNNPWHYKISWNPRNVVMAGSTGAIYKKDNNIVEKKYRELFTDYKEVFINKQLGKLAYYPNRDSLSYIPVYQLEDATTFIRTTLRYPIFCEYWKYLIDARLTNDKDTVTTTVLSFAKWAEKILPFINESNRYAFEYLGLFDETPVPQNAKTSADILQYLLETKLAMSAHDKDMIVMLHELEYEHVNKRHAAKSSLIVTGEDNTRTAMAKTVGLPLGIAAILILQEKIKLTGLHIPILPEIYIPVLSELKKQGVAFEETVS